MTGQPHDLAAEQAVLGSMLLSADAVVEAAAILTPDRFYLAKHGTVFRTITGMRDRGEPTDPVTVAARLADAGELGKVGSTYLAECLEATPSPATVGHYARIVADRATRREYIEQGTRLAQVGESDASAEQLRTRVDQIRARLADLGAEASPTGPERGSELDAYLGADVADKYDWLIPGLLEHGDRLILTGQEGHGKSTLLRQIGVQAASGIHPFSEARYEPLRVLDIDLENSDRQLRRELRPLRLAAGHAYAGGFVVKVRTDGLNLLDRADVDWFLSLLAEHDPHLLITGPAYKMAAGSPLDEEPARIVAGYLDRARIEHGCAIALEAHTPHPANGKKRPERPYGASLWLRWPEFGLFLSPEGHLRHWRGPRDVTREWPAVIKRGGAWPWSPVTRDRDVTWARVVAAVQAGQPSSQRALAKLLGVADTTLRRAIDEHRTEWEALTFSQVTEGGAP